MKFLFSSKNLLEVIYLVFLVQLYHPVDLHALSDISEVNEGILISSRLRAG